MKLHKAKRMCFAIHHGKGVILKWRPRTIAKMEKHRRKYNERAEREFRGSK